MATITKDTTNHIWLFSDTITDSSYNVVFDTLNSFLDAKIKASLTVSGGTIIPKFSNTNLDTYFDAGTEGSNSVSIIPKATNTGGFIAVHNDSSPVTGTPAYYKIKTGAGEANTANVVLYSTDGSNAGVNISGIVGTVSDTEPTSGYYLSFTGSGSSKIKTTGWMTAGTQLTAASKTRYFPITKAVTESNGGDVVVYTTDGSNAGVNISGIVGTKATTEPTSGYYLAFTGSGSSKVKTAGYLPLNDVTATGSSIKYFPITKAVTGNNGGDVVLYSTDGSNAGTNISTIVGTKVADEPTSGYYLAFTGSGSSKVTTAGYLAKDTVTTTGSSTKYFPITAAVLSVSKTGGSITPSVSLSKSSTLTWSTSDTSGVSVTGTGNGSVSNLSIKANVSTAGYIPSGDVATASSLSIAAAGTAATETKYITGVSIASGKSFTVTNAGTLTVTNSGTTTVTAGISGTTTQGTIKITAYPSSGTTADAVKTIVTNGRWAETTISAANTWYYGKVKAGALTVTTSADTGNLSTYFNTGSSSDNNVTITPKYTNTAGFKTAQSSATNNGGTTYWKIKTTSMTQNKVTTLKNNDTEIDTRANASWGTGWISSGTISPATFANSATANVTYIDISKTDAAPILISGDYLYINRGYVDDLKISLAKLIPDTLVGNNIEFAPANYILTGYAAFNAAGGQITGTMPKYNGAYAVNVS